MSVFVHPRAHRADRAQPQRAAPRPSFRSSIAAPPARFLMPPTLLGAAPDAPRPPEVPADVPDGAPMNAQVYYGRVGEAVEPDAPIPVTLWAWPSGRELWGALPAGAIESAVPGMRLRVWTWVEFSGAGERRPRVWAEPIEPP